MPIFEPGLDTLVATNVAVGRLKFTTDLKAAVAGPLWCSPRHRRTLLRLLQHERDLRLAELRSLHRQRLVADLSLDKAMLQDVVSRKL